MKKDFKHFVSTTYKRKEPDGMGMREFIYLVCSCGEPFKDFDLTLMQKHIDDKNNED